MSVILSAIGAVAGEALGEKILGAIRGNEADRRELVIHHYLAIREKGGGYGHRSVDWEAACDDVDYALRKFAEDERAVDELAARYAPAPIETDGGG